VGTYRFNVNQGVFVVYIAMRDSRIMHDLDRLGELPANGSAFLLGITIPLLSHIYGGLDGGRWWYFLDANHAGPGVDDPGRVNTERFNRRQRYVQRIIHPEFVQSPARFRSSPCLMEGVVAEREKPRMRTVSG